MIGQGARPVWIIARQHPGETMAEWFVEGLMRAAARSGRCGCARASPDGDLSHRSEHESRRLRTRQPAHQRRGRQPQSRVAGADAGAQPGSPVVRDAIHATGCAAFFDIHGDENLPYVFVAGCEMLPGFSDRAGGRAGRVQRGLSRGEPGLPERARIRREQVQGRRAEARVQVCRPYLRLPVADARDAVQGQRQRARRADADGALRAAPAWVPTCSALFGNT